MIISIRAAQQVPNRRNDRVTGNCLRESEMRRPMRPVSDEGYGKCQALSRFTTLFADRSQVSSYGKLE